MTKVTAFAVTEGGTAHKVNEDSFQLMKLIFPDTLDNYEEKSFDCDQTWQVYSLCDGLGGPGVGDIAGRLVQDLLKEKLQKFPKERDPHFSFTDFAQRFLDEADQLLQQRLPEDKNGAGCSIAMVLIHGSDAYTLSIGSARIVLLRGHQIFQMSKDHRLGTSWRDRPLLFLGHHPGSSKVKAQNMKHLPLEVGDLILILSDGVSLQLEADEIQEMLEMDRSLNERVRRIHQLARERNAEDSQTVLALQYLGSGDGEPLLSEPLQPAEDSWHTAGAGRSLTRRPDARHSEKERTVPPKAHRRTQPKLHFTPNAQPLEEQPMQTKPSLLDRPWTLFGLSFLGGVLLAVLLLFLFYFFVMG